MAPVDMAVGIRDVSEKDALVNNYSVDSFDSQNNELTITRSLSDRRYSKMHFKQADKNRVDIVITQGFHNDERKHLRLEDFTSQDIRRQYSVKAKCLVTIVFFMLFSMFTLLLICLFQGAILEENNLEESLSSSGPESTSRIILPTLLNRGANDTLPHGYNTTLLIVESSGNNVEHSTPPFS